MQFNSTPFAFRISNFGYSQSGIMTVTGEIIMKFSTPAGFGIMALLLFAPLNTWAANSSEGCGSSGWAKHSERPQALGGRDAAAAGGFKAWVV